PGLPPLGPVAGPGDRPRAARPPPWPPRSAPSRPKNPGTRPPPPPSLGTPPFAPPPPPPPPPPPSLTTRDPPPRWSLGAARPPGLSADAGKTPGDRPPSTHFVGTPAFGAPRPRPRVTIASLNRRRPSPS